MSHIRIQRCGQTGMRNGFWDLNGTDWHSEANGGCGILSYMSGANVSLVRCSYNGASAGGIYLGAGYWPDEMGANYTEIGYGNAITNMRIQECWGASLVIANQDPLNAYNGRGNKNTFTLATIDDTANLVPAKGASTTRYPDRRPMILLKGNTVTENVVELATGSGQVWAENFATHGYFDTGNPSNNQISLKTPGISNSAGDWYDGYSADTPGPWGTDSASSIAARGNVVSVNGQIAA